MRGMGAPLMSPSVMLSPLGKRLRESGGGWGAAMLPTGPSTTYAGRIGDIGFSVAVLPDVVAVYFAGAIDGITANPAGDLLNVAVKPLPVGGDFDDWNAHTTRFLSLLPALAACCCPLCFAPPSYPAGIVHLCSAFTLF